MQWAISKSHESIGERGEKLKDKKLHGLGDKALIDGETVKVGAGGYLGGVKLAVSSDDNQKKNRAMLESLFKKEEKKREKRLKELQKRNENTT